MLATVIIKVENHKCKDYTLSASDQSLIDMMKHYLHTSRKDECSPPSKTSNAGVTYVRWGKKGCPKGAEIVYSGQVGGNDHTTKGGGVNYLCLPNDPENGQHQSFGNDQIFGGEYRISSSGKPSGWSESMRYKEAPCTVGILYNKGWNSEYDGYLTSDHYTHNNKDFACVDINPETLDNKNKDEHGILFQTLRTKCGSLRCPPYTNEADVLCVVCSKKTYRYELTKRFFVSDFLKGH
ncbi:unnamed protein product [Mytilus coruscus]|uniref:Uncharacterized protein n=1 Tax=Mytilus coruscus TaxID=42192 RepID=A0A6J8A8D8_MYTCO|nr:unnamed protein product [Mytilus coruscus]